MPAQAPPAQFWQPFAIGDFVVRAITGWWQAGRPSVSVTSWFRTPVANRLANGDPNSQHLVGLAIDLVPDDPDLARFMQAVGLTAVSEGTHLHIQRHPAGFLERLDF